MVSTRITGEIKGGSGPAGVLTFDKDTYMLTPEVGPIEPVVENHSDAVGF